MRHVITMLGLCSVLLSAGCGDAQCGTVCAVWQECFADNIDVPGCIHVCSAASADRRDHADRAADCAECYGGKTCAERASRCSDECLGVQGFFERE